MIRGPDSVLGTGSGSAAGSCDGAGSAAGSCDLDAYSDSGSGAGCCDLGACSGSGDDWFRKSEKNIPPPPSNNIIKINGNILLFITIRIN